MDRPRRQTGWAKQTEYLSRLSRHGLGRPVRKRTDYIPGTKVPGNIRSRERKFPGTFVPRSESSRELSFLGAKVPTGNFRSEERKYRGAKSLIPYKSRLFDHRCHGLRLPAVPSLPLSNCACAKSIQLTSGAEFTDVTDGAA